MSILSSFFKYFGSSSGFSLLNGCGTFTTDEYISKIYENPSFTIAEEKKTKALKALEWGVFRQTKDNQELIKGHVLSKLFEMPNTNVTWGEFLEYMTVWYDGKDNGVLLEKVIGLKTMRPNLNMYNPENFTVYTEGFTITKIEITNPHKIITDPLELENYMWIKQPNFYNESVQGNYSVAQTGDTNQRGMALNGAYVYNSWRWNNASVKNGKKRSGVYSSDKPIPPDEKKKFEQGLEARNTLDDKGKALIVGGNMKFTADDAERQDNDWNEGETKAHDRIVSSLGVAPELTGSGNSTFENRSSARKELYHETVIPWAKEIANRLNIFLVPWLKPGEYIWFITDSISALRAEMGEAIKSLSDAKDRLTIDEYRAALSELTGKSLRPISDVLLVQSSQVPLDDIINSEEPPEEDEEE